MRKLEKSMKAFRAKDVTLQDFLPTEN
jgi:hypothetical protein